MKSHNQKSYLCHRMQNTRWGHLSSTQMAAGCPVAGQCEGGSEHSYWAQILVGVTAQVSTGSKLGAKTQRRRTRRRKGKNGLNWEEEQEQGLQLRRWEDLWENVNTDGHESSNIKENMTGKQTRGVIKSGERGKTCWNAENKRKTLMMSWWGQDLMTTNIWIR